MCNLSQGIYDDGVAEGLVKGVAEGEITKAIKVVENLLAKGFFLDEALSIADVDITTKV